MKNLLFACIAFLLISCSASKSGSTSPKLTQRTLKGTWEVSDIRFVGAPGTYKADLFDLADSPCFKNGEWVFIPNNGTGKFGLSAANRCPGGSQRILWSFNDQRDGTAQFSFKFVDERNKPLSGDKSGYRTIIEGLTEYNFEMRVKSSYNGSDFDVVMTFQRVSDDIAL